MFYIFPEDFEGCESDIRVSLDGKDYKPCSCVNYESITFYDRKNDYAVWKFDTEENRDKALAKIDEIVAEHQKQSAPIYASPKKKSIEKELEEYKNGVREIITGFDKGFDEEWDEDIPDGEKSG